MNKEKDERRFLIKHNASKRTVGQYLKNDFGKSQNFISSWNVFQKPKRNKGLFSQTTSRIHHQQMMNTQQGIVKKSFGQKENESRQNCGSIKKE